MFTRIVLQILFRISQSNGKMELHEIRIWKSTLRTDFSEVKSVFGFRVRLQNPKSGFPNRTQPKLVTEDCIHHTYLSLHHPRSGGCHMTIFRGNLRLIASPIRSTTRSDPGFDNGSMFAVGPFHFGRNDLNQVQLKYK